MKNSQQKAWSMKHPALAKAFAVALAVMSLILIFAGVKNYTEAGEENEERLRYEAKYSERIANYIELDERLKNSISYDEAWAELEKLIEQHEDDASQHKTDLAMYSAEKGGNTMGANMIWEMLPELKAAKAELEAGKKMLAEQETGIQQAKAGCYGMIAAANQGAAACGGYIAQLNGLISAIDAEPAKPGEAPPYAEKPEPEVAEPTEALPAEPQMPAAPVEPLAPVEPVAPTEPTEPGEAPVLPENPTAEQQAEYDALKAQYDAAVSYAESYPGLLAQYEAELEAYKAYSEIYPGLVEQYTEDEKAYNEAMTQYNADKAEYDRIKPSHDAYAAYKQQLDAYTAFDNYQKELEAYTNAYTAWMTGCMGAIAQTDLVALGTEAANQGAALQQLSGTAMALINSFAEMLDIEIPGIPGTPDAGGGDAGGGFGGIDEGMTPEQMIAAAREGAAQLVSAFSTIQGGYSGVAYGLGLVSQGITEAEPKIAKYKQELAVGEEMLKKGEKEAMAALENIWYNLGELEKDRAELEDDKARLDEESEKISREILEADELRELENDKVSAKLLLTSVKEVNDMVEEGGDIVGSAEKYLESYKADTQTLHKGRVLVSLLALIGGIAGLAALPAVYEFTRRRFWLIWPVLLCILCAAAAEAVYYLAVHEMWYVGLFVVIIAAIHLLIVAPKEKKPDMFMKT